MFSASKIYEYAVSYNELPTRRRGMTSLANYILAYTFLVLARTASPDTKICPSPESILPCICTNRHEDVQIW